MEIKVTKEQMPLRLPEVEQSRQLEHYRFEPYQFDDDENAIIGSSEDIDIEAAINIGRNNFQIFRYEVFFEIPDSRLTDPVPPEAEQIALLAPTYGDMVLLQQGQDISMRYLQELQNNQFLWTEIETIKEDNIAVYSMKQKKVRLTTADYQSIVDPQDQVAPLETIEWINENYAYGQYWDILHAHITMEEVYTDKGTTDALRWAACTPEEQEILVQWNIVGLNRAQDLIPPGWSEGRALKETARKYRAFSLNMILTLQKRFDIWYTYLNLTLSNAGKTKFEADWQWDLEQEYTQRYQRQFEIGQVNKLEDWHDTVLATYTDTDFIGQQLNANQIVTNLRKVLFDKTYFL